MDIKSQITIRSKKLGILIRDARMIARRNLKECADAIGVKGGVFRAYEEIDERRNETCPVLLGRIPEYRGTDLGQLARRLEQRSELERALRFEISFTIPLPVGSS